MSLEGIQLISSGPGHFVWDRELPLKRRVEGGIYYVWAGREPAMDVDVMKLKQQSDLYRSNIIL